jgi:hypothetical protein
MERVTSGSARLDVRRVYARHDGIGIRGSDEGGQDER